MLFQLPDNVRSFLLSNIREGFPYSYKKLGMFFGMSDSRIYDWSKTLEENEHASIMIRYETLTTLNECDVSALMVGSGFGQSRAFTTPETRRNAGFTSTQSASGGDGFRAARGPIARTRSAMGQLGEPSTAPKPSSLFDNFQFNEPVDPYSGRKRAAKMPGFNDLLERSYQESPTAPKPWDTDALAELEKYRAPSPPVSVGPYRLPNYLELNFGAPPVQPSYTRPSYQSSAFNTFTGTRTSPSPSPSPYTMSSTFSQPPQAFRCPLGDLSLSPPMGTSINPFPEDNGNIWDADILVPKGNNVPLFSSSSFYNPTLRYDDGADDDPNIYSPLPPLQLDASLSNSRYF